MNSILSEELVSKGINFIKKRDKVLATIIVKVGEFNLAPRKDHFSGLVRIIIGQQLSYKAARSIFRKFENNLCQNITPEKIVSTPLEVFYSSGLSRNKTSCIRELSSKIIEGELSLQAIEGKPTESVINTLVKVKGIGKWTANNYLIFVLGHIDILPLDDLAFRRAIKLNYSISEDPSVEEINLLARKWGNYKTIAAWYLWETINRGLV